MSVTGLDRGTRSGEAPKVPELAVAARRAKRAAAAIIPRNAAVIRVSKSIVGVSAWRLASSQHLKIADGKGVRCSSQNTWGAVLF
jgi:hypothetical protein